MGGDPSVAPAANPVAPSSPQLQGSIQEFSNEPPGGTKKCPIPLQAVALSLNDLRKAPKNRNHGGTLRGRTARNNNKPLQGSANRNNGNLTPQTPSLGSNPPPAKPKVGKVVDENTPPPGATLFDPLHPQLGQWAPPSARKPIPGVVFDKDGYYHPQEAAREDWQDELFVSAWLGGWIVNLFGNAVVPLLPRVPNNPEVDEVVWVNVRANGQKIVWRNGQTWFRQTKTGYETTLKKALEDPSARLVKGQYFDISRTPR
jgi:hypothetical protein